MNNINFPTQDIRIEKILNMINRYTVGEFEFQETPSEKGDEIDTIISSLNALGKSRAIYVNKTQSHQRRIETIVEVILKYTLLDFSEKVPVSEEGDGIDAIAIGLNTLTEELQAAMALDRSRLETIKEATAQVETIIENAPNAVIVIDEAGTILRWNKKSEVIFGWEPHEVLNKPMHNFIMPTRYINAHHNGIAHFLNTGEGPVINHTIEITAIRRNTEEFPIELSISAIKSKGSHLFIAFISDISLRKQSEDLIKKTNLNLENSVKELEAFTYSVSHDLRAPLRAIHGYMNILWNNHAEGLDTKAKTMMTSIMANSKKMGQLIDDLLALSRLGRADLQRKKTDMNKIVQTILTELSSTISNKYEIIVHPLPETFVDSNLMVQVYTNLISNAIKYSSLKEHPVIEIGSTEENGERVYYVKDSGNGFDMKFYNKLFGVFQRLHDATEFEGNGVGLSIVKQIILKHEGRIWATSEVGKGACFNFTLKKHEL